MLRYISNKQLTIEGFKTPFETHLNPENKWVKLANAIPWDDFVSIYTHGMSKNHGRPSIPPRVAVAALIIKHMEDLDDRSVVAALEENIYMQYFAGYPSFTTKPPFDPSMLVDMRIRMGAESFDKMIVILIKIEQPGIAIPTPAKVVIHAVQDFMTKQKFNLAWTQHLDETAVVVEVSAVGGRCGEPLVGVNQPHSGGQIAKKRSSK